MTTPVDEVRIVEKITAKDRCDRCGAQAYVRTEHAGLELFWCAHHHREHQEKLSVSVVADETARL